MSTHEYLNICIDRLHGKVILYEYDDPTHKTPLDRNLDPEHMSVHPKMQMKGDVHITIWHDSSETDENKQVKWAVAIKGSGVKFVPMLNRLFNRKVTGSHWIQMQDIGKVIL